MSNTFLALPRPTGNGSGASVDATALGALKTITVGSSGGVYEPITLIELSNDGGTSYSPVATFNGPGTTTLSVAAGLMRMTISRFIDGVVPNVEIGASSDTVALDTFAVPAGSGSGAAVDASSLGGFKTVQVSWPFGGGINIEISQDGGASWATQFTFVSGGPSIQSAVVTADLMRVTRVGVPQVSPGLPSVSMASASSAAGGASVVTDGVTTQGIGTTGSPISLVTPLNVKSAQFGAVGDGVTDDFAAIQKAVTAAISDGIDLYFPPGQYKVSKSIDCSYAQNIEFFAEGCTFIYPSDDTTIPLDPVRYTRSIAQSGFYAFQTMNFTVRGFHFVGGTTNIENINNGSCVYGRHAINLHVIECHNTWGGSLLQQDTTPDTAGTGDSIAVAGGVVTLTDSAGLWVGGHVNHIITVANATNQVNNGYFQITNVISPTQIQYVNANAVAETSSFQWSVEDHDQGARLERNTSYGAFYVVTIGPDSTIANNTFEQPNDYDMVGIGDQFTFDGVSKVTLFDQAGRFEPQFDGKYIKISGATTPANNGIFKLTYISTSQISWTNAAGASELFTGSWYIQNGTKTGTGAGVGSISVNNGVVTFTSAQAVFDASDLNKTFRTANCANTNNINAFHITAVLSPTQIQYNDANGVNEDFSGMWALDPWDASQEGSGGTATIYGTGHAIYLFSGGAVRTNVDIYGNAFHNIRTCCVKVSGTALPIRSIRIHHNYARECAVFAIFGADGQQEHSNCEIYDNQIVDCATQREGWNNNDAITILGSRDVSIRGNQFYYTHNNVAQASGLSIGSQFAIQAYRYAPAQSQPIESVHITDNVFSALPNDTTPSLIIQSCIQVGQVGILTKWNTGVGKFTKVGSVVTYQDTTATFLPQEQVGQSVTFVNATSNANNGTFTITACTTTTISFTNASGVAENFPGTYRIAPNRNGGSVLIANNRSQQVGTIFATLTQNACPIVHGNTWNGCVSGIRFAGDLSPEVTDNREISTVTQSPRMRLDSGTSWPRVRGNTISSPSLDSIGTAFAHDITISVDSSNAVDYPLLGYYIRARPSQGLEEVVFAYGSLLVDGDTFTLTDGGGAHTFTYQATAPGANQFNSFAGLMSLINALGSYTASDYGTGLSGGDVTTLHMRIRANAVTTADGTWSISSRTLNPTALVVLHNQSGNNAACSSRGSADAGPVLNKTVIWSPCCTFAGGGSTMVAENASAMTLLASGYMRKTNVNDGGCCNLMQHGASAGTEEFRTVVNSAA